MAKRILLMFVICTYLEKNFPQDITARYYYYYVDEKIKYDSTFLNKIQSCRDSLHVRLNEIIGISSYTLYKKQPESLLGNLVADCARKEAERVYAKKVDMALIAFGSLGKPLEKGEVTERNIYGILPSNPFLVLVNMDGRKLKEIIQKSVSLKGWPISGVTFKITDWKAGDIILNKKALEEDSSYSVVLELETLRDKFFFPSKDKLTIRNEGLKLRDAIINQIRNQTEEGKPIETSFKKRIEIENE